MRGPLHSLAVKLNGLGPLLAGKSLIGLLLHALQIWGQLHLGAVREEAKSEKSKVRAALQMSAALFEGQAGFLSPWDLH